MIPINEMSAWSWGDFVCGIFCAAAGGVCTLAGCSIDGPSPVADATLAKASVFLYEIQRINLRVFY